MFVRNKRTLGESIEERPAVVETREDFGHWKIDIVFGKRIKGSCFINIYQTQEKSRINL